MSIPKLLRLEFTTAPIGSFNGDLGNLIKQVRHYSENVSMDDFKSAIPNLKILEKKINDHNDLMGDPRQPYIENIMAALDVEHLLENEFREDLEYSAKAMLSIMFHTSFNIHDFDFELRNHQSVYWLEYYGCKNEELAKDTQSVASDIFKSLCKKHEIIFVDSTAF